ncbi:hypothetical protein GCM10010978_25980 [Compostibacillus humi]|uniref:Sensory transduction regulator n=1 Tax=Compostibacillus humi TaxID=1245525 RepID=A0A8J2TP02_9BACI|nr:YbjN domain-containing protein [Compostibacillus humi]GFZ84447.1 hypothetical protein GCM10010978_25980 [Compostibacillus humi]
MSNSAVFQQTLNEKNIYMERNQDEGGVFFRVHQSIKGGGNVLVVVFFSNNENIVDINIFNIARIDNPLKKEELHKLLNELNKQFRYAKFIEDQGGIFAQDSIDVHDYFSPMLILDHVAMLINTVEDVYPKFMKLQWA